MEHIWQRIWAVIRLVRPMNVLLFLAGVGVGGVLAGGASALVEGSAVGLAAVSAALIGGAANSLNDVFDVEIDRINRPDRPLPAGEVSVRLARLVWAAGSATGLAVAALVSLLHLGIAALAAVLLYAYNARLKRTVLLGNLVVAVVVGLALIYGGMAVGRPGAALVGAGFAALTTLARELIKDLEDQAGDAAAGARTLPVRYGPDATRALLLFILALTVALTPLPYLLLGYSGLFLLLVLVADGLLLRSLSLISQTPPIADRAGSLLKVAMIFGLAALAAAPFG